MKLKYFTEDNTISFCGKFCTHKKVYTMNVWNSGENRDFEYITLTFKNGRRVTFLNDKNDIAYKDADVYLRFRFLFNLYADVKNFFNKILFKK